MTCWETIEKEGRTLVCHRRKNHRGMHKTTVAWGNLQQFDEEHKDD